MAKDGRDGVTKVEGNDDNDGYEYINEIRPEDQYVYVYEGGEDGDEKGDVDESEDKGEGKEGGGGDEDNAEGEDEDEDSDSSDENFELLATSSFADIWTHFGKVLAVAIKLQGKVGSVDAYFGPIKKKLDSTGFDLSVNPLNPHQAGLGQN